MRSFAGTVTSNSELHLFYGSTPGEITSFIETYWRARVVPPTDDGAQRAAAANLIAIAPELLDGDT
jgi:hypothetical protein